MLNAPIGPGEGSRLQELMALEILDSAAESEFDDIVALASDLTGCPISLISLIDLERQWFKAKIGLDAAQTARDVSFCGHAIEADQIFIVENTLLDARFADNPLVTGDPHIRFYAGQPLITSSGERIGTLCIIDREPRHLTERQKGHMSALARQVIKLFELRLVNRRQQLRSLTKTQFLNNMSHEIRTPLTGILGYASIARETLERERPDSKSLGYLENIDRQAKHILSIVGNVLDLAKIESGNLQLDIAPFPVHELRLTILTFFSLEASKKNVTLTVDVAEGMPTFINGDFTRIKQILINLVGNALKFTGRGSVRLELSFDAVDEFLVARVTDTGLGMTPEQTSRLFQPFMQAEASIQTQFGGSGLGLALSQEMAKSMHGDLILERSQMGEGSVFVARLKAPPAKPEHEAHHRQNHAVHNTLSSIGGLASILVADDSEDTRFILQHLLKSFSMTADEAVNGAGVLNRVARQNYDVIFLDLQMPDQDGFAVLKQVRALRPKVKVVAFTAHITEEAQREYRKAGFDYFLAKPFNAAQLSQVLFETLVY